MVKAHALFTEKLIDVVVNQRKKIEIIFAVMVVLSILSIPLVHINYDLTEYLPPEAPSTQGIDLMEQEFSYPGSARVMIGNVSIYEAMAYKEKIAQIDGVDQVSWADTMGQIYVSEEYLATQDLEDYYRDGYAVMDIQFVNGDADKRTYAALDEIRGLLGDKGYFSGPAIDNKTVGETLAEEVVRAMFFVVVIILGILTLTTNSWFEPFLFMLTMGIAIIINMGSNLIFGTISFLSFSVSAILQLAVAMDYSIFLLHTFTAEKAKGLSVEQAMMNAVRISISSIVSSGATTIIGFIVLALMQFSIGRDMGFVMAKGIVFSMLTVLFLMPALIIRWHKWIDKTQHRPFVPPFDKFARGLFKIRYLVGLFVLLTVVPCYVAQGMNDFMYGVSVISSGEGTRAYEEKKKIDEVFGQNNPLIILVPNESPVLEKRLTDDLDGLPFIRSATSMAGTMPEGIPEDFLPKSITEQLHTERYARILVNVISDVESPYSFSCADKIREIVNQYYPQDTHFLGMTSATQDMKNTITADYGIVNWLSILGVALVIMITFRSVTMPLAVIIPIEVAIFINMALPYLVGEKMVFLGYLMVSSMQLGATVDYSILLTNNYLGIRAAEPDKKKAAVQAITKSALSILTSGTVLTVVGYGLYFISSVGAISNLGRLLGRGALLSTFFVLSFLPTLLTLLDNIIFKDREIMTKIIKLKEKGLLRKLRRQSPIVRFTGLAAALHRRFIRNKGENAK
ncbi:efflux RND transporter permease subunit [Marasmitruncus massiliensis]|uniref:efflux RND transporter permease subunit n=1 Tax=Marasmitruncus massiliensis TaxID=1944642 RepID=UPI000C7D4406|nr:MMPL family transporter [Marasmitruncus massiliensis]